MKTKFQVFNFNHGTPTRVGDLKALVMDATDPVTFSAPEGMFFDDDSFVVADMKKHCVFKIGYNVHMTQIAGGNGPGYIDGDGLTAKFRSPMGVCRNAVTDTVVYVADTGNHCVRAVNMQTRNVSTLAGSGYAGMCDGYGCAALFHSPQGVFAFSDGVLLVADTGNHCLRTLDCKNKQVTTVIEVENPTSIRQYDADGLLVTHGDGEQSVFTLVSKTLRPLRSYTPELDLVAKIR